MSLCKSTTSRETLVTKRIREMTSFYFASCDDVISHTCIILPVVSVSIGVAFITIGARPHVDQIDAVAAAILNRK